MRELILIVAAWRLTSLLVNEDGPFDMLARFRKFIGVYYDENSQRQGKNVIAKAINCAWCCSIWIALFASVFSEYSVNVLSYLLHALFISACIIFIDECILLIERH